jgi:ribosomal protein L39E
MSLASAAVRSCRHFKGRPSQSSSMPHPSRSLVDSRAHMHYNTAISRSPSLSRQSLRFCAQNPSSSPSPASSASTKSSKPIAPPNMTNMPKAMLNLKNPIPATSDIGEIEIGPDGVVVPAKRPSSTAASRFVIRKSQANQQELLKRMFDIDKKIRLEKEAKQEKEVPADIVKPKAAYKRPELVVYHNYPRRWIQTLNGLACLASVRII